MNLAKILDDFPETVMTMSISRLLPRTAAAKTYFAIMMNEFFEASFEMDNKDEIQIFYEDMSMRSGTPLWVTNCR